MTNNQKLAVDAVTHMLHNLADSDFVLRCGDTAIKELRAYRADMAIDIAEKFDGRRATDEEKNQIVERIDKR